MLHAVTDEFSHCQHLQSVFLAELGQIRHPRHSAVFFHDFANDAGGNEAGHTGKIYGCLGLSRSHQHTAFARA